MCPRCDDRRRKIRIRAQDNYDPARNKKACARYHAKHRLAKLMYDHLRWMAQREAERESQGMADHLPQVQEVVQRLPAIGLRPSGADYL
jgi:hypothetical protein